MALLVSSGATASAATIVYSVNQTIASGSVTGTIQTDGVLGTLGQSNITGFSLTVAGPGASVLLTQANSIIVESGGHVSATATDLSFDYSGGSAFLLFQFGSFGTGQKYYCNSSVSDTCFQGASAVPDTFNSASAQIEAREGVQSIGTAVVPEPASWALMIGGFGMVGATMRRRSVVVTA